jgi:hypothetical protein
MSENENDLGDLIEDLTKTQRIKRRPKHSPDEFSISIDGIEFLILGRDIYKSSDEPRETVTYTLKSDPQFWYSAYRSNSEIGFWRLMYLDYFGFDKGDNDYVQQTFIHLKLQSFINDIYDKLPQKPYFTRTIYGQDNKDNKFDGLTIKMAIDDHTRHIKVAPFDFLLKQKDNYKCGKSMFNLNEKLEAFSKILYNNYSIKCYKEVISNYYFEFQRLIVGNGNVYCIILEKRENGTMQDENTPSVVYLYCLLCNLEQTSITYSLINKTLEDICAKNLHVMPLLCTKDDAHILPSGLYSHYINCGGYICKLFDYKQQCSMNEAKQLGCSKQYNYIGYRFEFLFPYKFLMDTIQTIDSFDGGKKKKFKIKTKKKNGRYKKSKNYRR